MKRLAFLFFVVLLLFSEAKAEEDGFGLNPFLTQEERERFKEGPGYVKLQGIELSVILYSPGNSKAIIDGKIVREGDVLEGKQIVKITSQAVILADSEQQFILELSALAASMGSQEDKENSKNE